MLIIEKIFAYVRRQPAYRYRYAYDRLKSTAETVTTRADHEEETLDCSHL